MAGEPAHPALPRVQGSALRVTRLSALGLAFTLAAPGVFPDNLIKDLSGAPLSEIRARCDAHDWQGCRELGVRAHYGLGGAAQDLAAAGRFYAQAQQYADESEKFRGIASDGPKTLALDVRCAALGVKIVAPGSYREVAEDCVPAYYEGRASGDFKEAVACAQRVQQAETLAMLYANGHGVPRDLDRARRAACEYLDVSAERDGMLRALFAMEEGDVTKPFDFCDFVTSGHTGYRCASYRAETTGQSDGAALEQARARWTPPALAEWTKLEPIASAYFDAEADADTYGSRLGTAHVAMIEDEVTDLRHAFSVMIAGAEGFRPASETDAANLAELDRELNAQYAKGLSAIGDPEEREAARVAERAWIRYRDAVVAFFQAELAGRFPPDAIAEAMLAHLTRERVGRLRTQGP